MPRIYTSTSDPVDFCVHCFPSEAQARAAYANLGDGPDGRGNCFAYDAEHPDYQDEGYRCESCKSRLSSIDNDALTPVERESLHRMTGM